MLFGICLEFFTGREKNPSGIDAFKKELSVYKGAKGSIQFPLDKPIPLNLISRIVKYRVKKDLERGAKK
ncbi:MAG: hypothetical protein ABIR03_02980 [Ginsengibacter sp.]